MKRAPSLPWLLAVAQLCAENFPLSPSPEAITFARTARTLQSESYNASYFAEMHGATFYDVHGCQRVWERDYGPYGGASANLGFTVLDRVNE